MSTPAGTHASSRLVVVSYNGRCRRFDLDGDGRLSFAHIARVFRIPLNAPDDTDAWTLDDTSLRIDKSDTGALVTVSALRDLFPLPSGTVDQPLVLRTDDGDGPEPAPCQAPRQSRKSTGTPGRAADPQVHQRVQAAATTTALTPAVGRRRSLTSPSTRAAKAAAAAITSPSTRAATAAAAAGSGALAVAASPRRAGMVTPRPRNAGAAGSDGHLGGPGYETPGAASPLRGARTPLGALLGVHSPPGRVLRRLAPGTLELARPVAADSELFRHPCGRGTFYFTPAAAQHLPMLMACHLPPPLQRLLRQFTAAAQCVITARTMALYARTSEAEYFRDPRLEAALTEARSRNPPLDRYCAYKQQAVRLTGRKRKPGASPHPLGGGANPGGHTPLTARGGGAAATSPLPPLPAQPAGAIGCTDVDMDAGGWAFVGAATLHCPGGAACRKSGRHEDWLLSDGPDGRVTYLPVLYDDEEHSAVLLPLADPRVGGGGGTPLVWFRYEYESRGGRRGHNFWDRGLMEHLEQAVRDVAGEEALCAARGP